MMQRLGLGDAWSKVPRPLRHAALPTVVFILLIFYPAYYSNITSAIGTSSTAAQLVPTVGTMVIMTVYVVMALGLNVVVGYAGLLDLGYVAFYAAGAYIAGWFATQQFAPHNVHIASVAIPSTIPGLHINVWALLAAVAVFAALFGIVIGLPTLRLRGDYLAIGTLGFGEIVPQAVNNGDNWFGHNVTNGPNGLTPIDALGFGSLHNQWAFLPSVYYSVTNATSYYYWTGLALVVFTLFCCIRIRDSRLGRAWVAIREDEIAAAAMGVPLMRTKTLAYAIGAFFGGMAGCLFSVYRGGAFPDDFYLQISIIILCMVILGGMGNVWGVCLGGAVLAYLNYQGLNSIGRTFNDTFGTSISVPTYSFGIFGTVIVIMMLVRPQGL